MIFIKKKKSALQKKKKCPSPFNSTLLYSSPTPLTCRKVHTFSMKIKPISTLKQQPRKRANTVLLPSMNDDIMILGYDRDEVVWPQRGAEDMARSMRGFSHTPVVRASEHARLVSSVLYVICPFPQLITCFLNDPVVQSMCDFSAPPWGRETQFDQCDAGIMWTVTTATAKPQSF